MTCNAVTEIMKLIIVIYMYQLEYPANEAFFLALN